MKYIYLLSALFGLLLPMAVRAQNVSNTGAYPHYASPYVFHKNTATDIGYAYNSNGSMTRNPDRHIGLIEYDCFNNPRLIQFTDGSATEYVYDASGTKLKTVHRTAVPGIEVPYGTVYEHTSSTVLSSDSTLYAGPFVLSGDSLRYQYDGGSVMIPLDGSPVKPCFYALDHLGSVRLVVSADGQVIERNDYYPSGCLITENIDGETVILPYKYNGKELDPMHGLYTYDYGARQYDPATMLWDRMDPLCEENPEVSPYVYCGDNPVNAIDPDGKDVLILYKDKHGKKQLFCFSGFHGRKSIKIPDNQYIKDFITAYLYNAKHGGGKKTIQAVTNHKYKIYVSDSQYDETYYSGGDRQPTVYWESRQGLITTERGKQSAATALEHEMDHAVDDANNHKQHVERRQQEDSQYDNKEERRVITGSEAQTAKSNKEDVRKNHRGKKYRTISPISTRPLK